MDIAIATCRPLPEPDPDELLLLDALAALGIEAQCLAWDDPAAPFGDAALTVIRSTWNYYRNLDSFLSWADARGQRLLNPISVVRWNTHKSYLFDLQAAGVPCVPTRLVAQGSRDTLPSVLASRSWTDVVVKPAVSAASFETRRVRPARLTTDDIAWFARLARQRDMLVQPYVSSVDHWGERAVVAIDGAVSHAVRKQPRFAGGHEDVSGAVDVHPDERALADRAIAAGARVAGVSRLLYGRVDIARDDHGEPMVMELELVEPSLFLAQFPTAIPRFARAIQARLEEIRALQRE